MTNICITDGPLRYNILFFKLDDICNELKCVGSEKMTLSKTGQLLSLSIRMMWLLKNLIPAMIIARVVYS
jgi:hypothetical protein